MTYATHIPYQVFHITVTNIIRLNVDNVGITAVNISIHRMECAKNAPINYSVNVSVRIMKNTNVLDHSMKMLDFPGGFTSRRYTISDLSRKTTGIVTAQVMQGDQMIGWPEEETFTTRGNVK